MPDLSFSKDAPNLVSLGSRQPGDFVRLASGAWIVLAQDGAAGMASVRRVTDGLVDSKPQTEEGEALQLDSAAFTVL